MEASGATVEGSIEAMDAPSARRTYVPAAMEGFIAEMFDSTAAMETSLFGMTYVPRPMEASIPR
jgi:hypothetical protein